MNVNGFVRMVWSLFALISVRDQFWKSDTIRFVACERERCAKQKLETEIRYSGFLWDQKKKMKMSGKKNGINSLYHCNTLHCFVAATSRRGNQVALPLLLYHECQMNECYMCKMNEGRIQTSI